MSDPINLVYVASIGRSGTTLLECMMGVHSQMATIGELHCWPHEILEGGRLPTGSGGMITEDDFWLEMRERVDPLKQPAPQIHHFRETHDAGKTLRVSRLSDFQTDPLDADLQRQIDLYARNSEEVYRTFLDLIGERTGTRPTWVVDASKDPYRLCWLVRSGQFNIRVIHMVKNPSGFIYSVTKPHIHGEGMTGPRRIAWTVRQAGAWSVRNQLILMLADRFLSPEEYTLLKYEDLAQNPAKVFEGVCNLIGVPYEPEAIDNFRDGSPFAIAGNPMRQRSGGIRLDEKWRRELPVSSRLLTQTITSVNASRFGY